MERSMTAIALVAVLASCAPEASDDQMCLDAVEVIEECTGTAPALPAEGCIGEFRTSAQEVVAGGCEGLRDPGKADAFCSEWLRWTGLCDFVPVDEAAAVASVAAVCPPGRTDALCGALHARDVPSARTAAATALADDHAGAIRDPAFQLYLRERIVSLLVWNGVAELGDGATPSNYPAAAGSFLDEHFPAYVGDEDAFPLARTAEPPVDGWSCTTNSAIVFFPGVVRLMDRREFEQQAEAIHAALPCVHTIVVDTGSFVRPSVNADRAKAAIDALEAEVGPVDLHLIGYSQGASNVLQTLATMPEIAARTRTVMTMNGASHGSEVADLLSDAIRGVGEAESFCDRILPVAQPTCAWAASQSPRPAEFLMNVIAMTMGIPVTDLETWIGAEDDIAAAPTMTEFFVAHLPGVGSLTTVEAEAFWAEHGEDLPQHVLYTAFRSVITDTWANLPLSNGLFHALLERAGGATPYNDMQVRLENQRLGGPVAEVEIVMPVAEGNHWQWELATGAVDEQTMPADMTDRIPHRSLLTAYAQTLYEVGLFDIAP
ncbi:MAG: hypothetical protein DRJ42_01080 [Deltaproteobacteria bacterium]|nr:MAG: hypothetical protein DRJ42_01080 [Deltaproteobacteria bacterium]